MAVSVSDLLPIRPGDTVILDTDIGSDCDDAGALAILAHGCRTTGATLGAVVNDTDNRFGSGAIDAILSYYGYTVPIGQTTRAGFFGPDDPNNGRYNRALAERFSARFAAGTLPVRPAAEVYREALTAAADGSVVLLTVGFLNTAAEAFDADPALFARKVRCIVSMAGNFADLNFGEWNVYNDVPAAKRLFEECPVPIVFDGFELGVSLLTGFAALLPEHPVSVAYDLHSGGQRDSYDLCAVDFAFTGEGEDWEASAPFSLRVKPDGSLALTETPDGTRRFLRFASPAGKERIRLRLNALLAKTPER